IELVDGILLLFAQSPGLGSKDINANFFNHKKHRYGLQVTIICDDQKYITYFNSQYPGYVNGGSTFETLQMVENLQSYFGDGEYLLGNSAYTCWIRLVASFNLEKQFNKCLSHLRVIVENRIGILKAQSASLR
ncbi:hypothetical protein K440DRAFT_506987, partial [Wilcoxina mikolae CBS 423.85]